MENQHKIEFQSEETFGAYRAAEKYLKEKGYSFGSSCAIGPTGILKGEYQIAKWKNLTNEERKSMHGIINGNFRYGPVFILFHDGHKPEHQLIVS